MSATLTPERKSARDRPGVGHIKWGIRGEKEGEHIGASTEELVVRRPARNQVQTHAPRRAVPDSHASRAQPVVGREVLVVGSGVAARPVRQVTYTNGSTQGTGPSSAALAGSDLARRRVPSPAITRHGIGFVELPTPPNRRAVGGRTCSLLDDAEALMRALLVLVRVALGEILT